MSAATIVCRMALRNVLAYRRRSVLTASVIFLGVLCIAVVDAFMNGFGDRLVTGYAVADGHVRVSAPGYAARRELCPLDRLVPDPQAVAAAAGRAAAGERGFARVAALDSIRAACVVQRGDRSINLVARGAQAFLPDNGLAPPFAGSALASGRWPAPGERGMVLSAKAASRLRATPGDTLVVLASDAFGSFGAAELSLLGVARSSPGPDSCLVDLASMRELSGVESGAAELALYLVDDAGRPVDPRGAAGAVRALEAAARSAGLEALAWDAESTATASMLVYMDSFVYMLYAIFALVAGAGIANSVLLSVQDRSRDFATLRAVAFTSRAVKAIVGLETLILGAVASLAGAAAALAAIAALGPGGLRLPETTRAIAAWFPELIAARVDLATLAIVVAGGSLLPLLAAVYPLRILGRMRIREALALA